MRLFGRAISSKVIYLIGALALLFVVMLACSKKSNSGGPTGPGGPSDPGVLLSGDENANAAFATTEYFSFNAPSVILVDSTGLLANKISAVINPSATVGQVNAILDSVQAFICYMEDTSLFVTLIIPAAVDSTQLAAICEALRASGAFLFAFLAHTPIPVGEEPSTELPVRIIPNGPAATNIEHLKKCLMPAAWNLKAYAEANPHKVSVIVSDYFGSLTRSPEIPSQRFLQIPGNAPYTVVYDGGAAGNHGFHVSGIIGATYDSVGTTGIHPGTTTLIEIQSLNSGPESWSEIMKLTADSIPRTTRSIVNTSLGYNDALFNRFSPLERMLYALQWRAMVSEFQHMFLHATSAGNTGDQTTAEGQLAVYNSPFCMAALMESEWDWIAAADLSDADSVNFNQVLRFIDTTSATNIFTPLQNVIVVGCSNLNGSRKSISSLGADVRMVVGEGVLGPCVIPDDACSNNFQTKGGTSQATPQVAGLAAYLMNLDENLTVYQAKSIIENCYDNTMGAVDAYKAVLSLDHGLGNAPRRRALLDVKNADGVFDEEDIEDYDWALLLSPARASSSHEPALLDFSRYDLNGDGYTGGSTRAKFDLTADNPPAYTTISATICGEEVTLNENSLTDEEILKYYANSSLFSGNPAERDQIFECSGGSFAGAAIVIARTDYVVASVVDHGAFGPGGDIKVRDADSTPYNPPYHFGSFSGDGTAQLTCQYDPTNMMSAHAMLSSSLTLSGGDTLTGVSFSASSEVSTTGDFCSMNADGSANFELEFQVVNAPVYFTLQFNGTFVKTDQSLTVETSYGYIGMSGPSGSIVDSLYTSGQTAAVDEDGQLLPGIYTLYVQGLASWDGTFDISGGLTFAPAIPARKAETSAAQSRK